MKDDTLVDALLENVTAQIWPKVELLIYIQDCDAAKSYLFGFAEQAYSKMGVSPQTVAGLGNILICLFSEVCKNANVGNAALKEVYGKILAEDALTGKYIKIGKLESHMWLSSKGYQPKGLFRILDRAMRDDL